MDDFYLFVLGLHLGAMAGLAIGYRIMLAYHRDTEALIRRHTGRPTTED